MLFPSTSCLISKLHCASLVTVSLATSLILNDQVIKMRKSSVHTLTYHRSVCLLTVVKLGRLPTFLAFENVVWLDMRRTWTNPECKYVLFVSAGADWCPAWRICFSTPSLKAKTWSPSLISSQWVTFHTLTPKTLCSQPPLTNTWTWPFTCYRRQHALAWYSIAFPQSLCNPVSQDPTNLGTIYRNRHTYIIHSEQKWVFSSCCTQTDAYYERIWFKLRKWLVC